MVQALEEELLERESEIALLTELVADARADSGRIALIEGPAGIGKSRLLQETDSIARAAGLQVAVARGSELEREFAFGLVRQLFEPLLGVADQQRAPLLAGAAHLAAPLFEALEVDELPQDQPSYAVLHGLYWLTVNIASERPIALVVDDAHWSDPPSLRFLAYLANRAADLPVFLAIGIRPFEPGIETALLDELAANPLAQIMRPAPLTVEAVRGVVAAEFAAEVDQAFAAACFETTKGNPLFLRELLVTLAAQGVTPTATQAESVLEAAPGSVARSLRRRLRRLPPEARALSQALALLGDDADLQTAAKLAGLDEATALASAEDLAQADILDPKALAFIHPVVRSAIYSDLSLLQRARQHRVAAGILSEMGVDEDEVGLHALAAEPSGERWVVEVLRRTARRAHARGAPDVATTYLTRALAEPPITDDRIGVLIELGRAQMAVGQPAGLATMREALRLAGDPESRAAVSLELGKALTKMADLTEAAEVFEDAIGELGGENTQLKETLEAQLISVCVPVASLVPRVFDRVAPMIADSERISDPVLLATLAGVVGGTFPPAAKGAELAERALSDGRLSVEEDPAVFAYAASALMSADRLDRARTVLDQALADARRRGSIPAVGMVSTFRAFVLIRQGELSAAEADARTGLESLHEGVVMPEPIFLAALVDVLLERGELEEAARLLEERGLTGELADELPINFLLESRGRLRAAQGRIDEGIADLRECGRRLEMVRNPGVIPCRISLAGVLAAAGRREEATALARQEIEHARAFQVPRELGMALRAAGLAEGGSGGIDLLREAVTVLEGSGAAVERARALTDLGAALRRQGQRSDARQPLRAGLDLAYRCGATALASRAHTELVATGARPRRVQLSGVDALTASERRVAEMASEGSTNREIAQALFVTEKTVEAHLGHAYRKLDITSRSALPQALIRSG